MSNLPNDPLKEKFRPNVDSDLDRELNEALGGMSIEQIEAQHAAASAAAAAAAAAQSPDSGVADLARHGVRRGRVVNIRKGDVLVDLGGKSQGIISELQFDDEPPVVGKEYDFTVERYDAAEGLVVLSRRTAGAVQQQVSWETIEPGTLVEGVVTGMNKGGLELQIKGMRAFMPAGQVNLFFEKDISVYLGQKLVVEVTQADALTHNLVVSRRNVLEREKEEAKKKLLEEIQEGDNRRGTVRSVTDFGAFVDLGGADGLVHVSEMSYKRIRHPSEVVKVGDQVDVKILKADKQSGKLSLSMRQAMPDPWAELGEKYPVATAVNGKVARVENFGAFVEIEEGVEGLLPVSEMSWQRIRSPKDVVKPGDTLRLVVIAVDPAQRKLTLSLKQAGPDPWKEAAEKFAPDMIVAGKVTRVVDFGAFVELEPGLEGLVHISELSNQRVRTAGDAVKAGQEVRVRILEVDKDARRVSLSIRRAIEAPPPSPEQLAAIEAQKKKKADREKKRSELKGGLDFDYWNKKL
ncbi:MAG TPA: S1 RNA-binding domain-containing protein [Tepidisphaeraceae bacterium]|jgi:small subunit ribosomal protein S1